MRPAPAANSASRTVSSASRGTKTTSFRFTVRPSAGGVDLRLLQLPRVVDVDRLPLGEDVERGLARLAVAVSAGDIAAREQLGPFVLPDLRVGVDLLERAPVDHRADVDALLPAGP